LRACHTLPTLLINRFAVVSTGWKIMSSEMPAHPAPKTLAVLLSRLKVAADGDMVLGGVRREGKGGRSERAAQRRNGVSREGEEEKKDELRG